MTNLIGLHGMKDLAGGIHRQRMVIEFTLGRHITEDDAGPFSGQLARAMKMTVLDLVTSNRSGFGPAVMCHWEYSGWALMGWNYADGTGFATVDIHSCRPFDYMTAVAVTQAYFRPDQIEYSPILASLATGWRPRQASGAARR